MASQSARDAAQDEAKLELTPMIDVTFLLLIFFLCTIKFKVLEGKIPAYLPKDVGVNTTPIEDLLEKIDVHVYRLVKAPTLDDLKAGAKWEWTEDQIKITVNGTTTPFSEFYKKISSIYKKNPELKATLYPMSRAELQLIYSDAVNVVNEMLRADLTDITFGGTPLDS